MKRVREIWLKEGYAPLCLAALPWVSAESAGRPARACWDGLVEIGTEAKLVLRLAAGSSVRYRITVPPRAIFLASIAPDNRNGSRAEGPIECRLDIRDTRGTLASSWARQLDPETPADWTEFRESLAPFQDREIFLTLSARSLTGNFDAAALWGDPAIRSRRRLREFAALARAYLALFGVRRAAAKLIELGFRPPIDSPDDYERWCARHRLSERAFARQRRKSRQRQRSVISLLLPAGGNPGHLSSTIESIAGQSYPHWQLCIAVFGLSKESSGMLQRIAGDDPRILLVPAASEEAALSAALAAAAGEFVAPVGSGDELAPQALHAMADAFKKQPQTDMAYSDEDRISGDGRRSNPFFKPDWSPDYFVSSGYTRRLAVYRRKTVLAAGGFRPHLGSAQEYDLVLRIADRGGKIHHVEDVLYHGRDIGDPGWGTLPEATEPCRDAAMEHFVRIGMQAVCAAHTQRGFLSVRFGLLAKPLISIVIPTGGRERLVGETRLDLVLNCIHSIFKRSSYANLEVLCIDDFNLRPETRAGLNALGEERLRLLSFPRPLNLADKMNWGAAQARGSQLVFLNDDTEVLTPDWLEALLEYSQQAAVGASGAKLLFPSGAIQHGGMAVADRLPVILHRWYPRHHPGYFGSLLIPCNRSSLLGACLMTRRDVFSQVGGFDVGMPFLWHDLDYCFKVRRNGLRAVFTPYAELYHFETASKPSTFRSVDTVRMARLWKDALGRDPFYNRHLRQDRADFRVAG